MPASEARSWQLSSAHVGTRRSSEASAPSSPAGSGCSTSATPRAASRGADARVVLDRPALVRVDDQPRVRGALAHGGQALEVGRAAALAAELDLQQRPARGAARRLAHRLGRIDRERVGRRHRPGLGQAREPPRARAALLRLEVPQRAVDGVARRSRGQHRLQRGAVQPVAERTGETPHLALHRVERLAVAGVGQALAAAPGAVAAQRHAQHLGRGARAARDAERAGDREALARHFEPDRAPGAAGRAAHEPEAPVRAAPIRASVLGEPVRPVPVRIDGRQPRRRLDGLQQLARRVGPERVRVHRDARDAALGVHDARGVEREVAEPLERRDRVARQPAHVRARRLVAQHERVGRGAVDQRERHARERRVEEAPLALDDVPVGRRVGRRERLDRAGHEVRDDGVERHAFAGDQDAGLARGAERRVAAAPGERGLDREARVHLADRAVGADCRAPQARARLAGRDRVLRPGHADIDQPPAPALGRIDELGPRGQPLVQPRRDVEPLVERLDERRDPRLGEPPATVRDADDERSRAALDRGVDVEVRHAEVGLDAVEAQLTDGQLRPPVGDAAGHLRRQRVGHVAEEEQVGGSDPHREHRVVAPPTEEGPDGWPRL